MTATQAGQPAQDPEDGHDASRTTAGADGAVTFDPGQADADRIDDPSLTADSGDAGGGTAERIALLRARLMTPMPGDRLWGWIGPLLVTLFAGFLRFNRLSVPNAIMFDETYYAKDAWSILKHGVEWNWIGSPAVSADYVNNQVVAGHFSNHLFQACSGTGCGEYVVQPEVGKLLIAVGEWLYGLTSLGWRVAPALFGTLAILVMCRVARRLTRSTLLGCTAGLLLSLDGLEFVLSRTGILDIFLMFFVLAAFGALVVDRDVSRERLAEAVVLQPGDEAGPELGIRKWRILAGVLIGLACATKQYGVWYIFAFVGLCVAWDLGARRTVGLRGYVRGALVRDGKWLPLTLGVIPLVTYILTWMNWLVTNTGYDRGYAQGTGFNIPVLGPLYSLFEYHKQMVQFGVGLSTRHPYESQPWDWFFITRPVAFYWNSYSDPAGLHVAKAGTTGPWVQEVLAIGNPAIWWMSIPAMIFCLGWWLTRRDWRAGAALLCVAAGWVSWLPFVSRTKFYYYALEFEPFLIICIVLCLGLILGPASAWWVRRAIGSALVGIYVLAVLVLFWYFYPILAGKIIPYSEWLSHVWYSGWI
ncbi:MAG: Dolichyl-phosphate-mannose--protein O-mannosyl transferase-like protein [Actinomycetia bacterium]|nr:Dolichyl-phosphate-mannose--protein O-mannosyl transferase-like protein [Actinomycetes bacterium]